MRRPARYLTPGTVLRVKLLVNPLLWYVLLQSAGLLVLWRSVAGRARTTLRGLLMLTLALAIVSTPFARTGIEWTLLVRREFESLATPEFIFILGGGYMPGSRSSEDVRGEETEQRVLQGVTLWRKYPKSHLVFSGGVFDYAEIRNPDRMVQLMAETAINRGVPSSAINLEPRSANTREHSIQAIKLLGVTAATTVAVVTSAWHLRRARQEFCRYFQRVLVYPVDSPVTPILWSVLIPDGGSLEASTTLVREWVGMAWYAILGIWNRTPPICRQRA